MGEGSKGEAKGGEKIKGGAVTNFLSVPWIQYMTTEGATGSICNSAAAKASLNSLTFACRTAHVAFAGMGALGLGA